VALKTSKCLRVTGNILRQELEGDETMGIHNAVSKDTGRLYCRQQFFTPKNAQQMLLN
jgi:hypothetical protein